MKYVMAGYKMKNEKVNEVKKAIKEFVGILYPDCEEEPVFTELMPVRSNKIE